MESLNISRMGEPRPVGGPSRGSLKRPNEYKIDTTPPLPAGPRGYNWFMFFNDQLKGPLVALHHRNQTITVHCDPDVHRNWLELVDAAIEKANGEEAKIQYEKGTV